MDYLRLAECFYAFLLPGHWLKTDTGEILRSEDYQMVPKIERETCLPLPQADEESIRKAYFEHINNLTFYKKYLRMQRTDKDPETVNRHFWWMLIDEGLSEAYRSFLEQYLMEFGKDWCREQGIPCSDKPLNGAARSRN